MQKLKAEYIQPKQIDLNAGNYSEIIDYLSRCRIARYGDCDVNAIEAALILANQGKISRETIQIVTDQKWGHTYVKIKPHGNGNWKVAVDIIVDPWANYIATNVFQRKVYVPKEEKLSSGESTLTRMKVAENFIRNKYEYQANDEILKVLKV
ncbi:MAG: hypothetical protein F6J94_23565 [Moorea sp. SIO1F2]|uniref:hypothetical protein n=1 Tax=unclassified Moorena TaxID=2683338 RepID=UPI0013B7AD85|nr:MULTISPECIES: hypothetical protein [unclassified Moorena]NEN98797.1 hypothetical protein [Moorena sp. SIO3I7]NEQ81567.1 hypothetical protein [Moorena sp. SIO2I5]NEO09494.1 hypothetical protein [Moorena sp. SIO3I8]NEO82364.1 hypothetical protein [Moorena sp. SIO4G3]NET84783.1 hypothetical protein [Moorena sp. SIO1F2]